MFELKDPTSGKLKKAEDKAIKIGQKDRRPAALITLEHTLPNTALEMFDGDLRDIVYGPGSPGEKGRKQDQFEGMDMVQDRPALTPTGQALATLNWGKEQSGCTLTIDHGTGDDRSNLTLKDGKVVKDTLKISLLEGGAVKVQYKFHAPVDHLTAAQIGQLHLLHQRDVTVTLLGPQIDSAQTDLAGGSAASDADPPAGGKAKRGASTVTPIKALAGAEAKASGDDAGAKS